jgi:flagellar hook-associated protein 1
MSIFDISVSGLLTNQAAISTTSHNIANANVEGYSRQRVSQSQRNPEFIGGNYMGTGVEVGNVKRIFEASQQLQLQASTADFFSYESYLSQASRVDGLLADSDNGINNAIQGFFTALQDVVNNPASIPARQVMLSESEMMVSRFDQVHSQLESQITEINGSISSMAEEISSLAEAIAKLNNDISGAAGNFPPDMLDRRDAAINRLSELVAVQTLDQADGTLSVFIGTGQSLVIGSLANTLTADFDPLDPRSMQLRITAGTSSLDVTTSITGGKLGGSLGAVEEIMEPAFNTLGRVAMAIADTFNAQNRLGIDLNNTLGGDFFTDINESTLAASRATSSSANTGTSVLSITIDDASQLGDSNYRVFQSGGNLTLVDLASNTTVGAPFAPPASPGSFTPPGLGFTINFLSGATANGDNFELQPTRNFARDFNVEISTSEEIAAASPIRAEQSLTNIGSAFISDITVTDTSSAQFTTTPNNLAPPIRIAFDTGGATFSVYDMTSGSPVLLTGGIAGFVAGQKNNMLALAGAPYNTYGYDITLDGEPQGGDSFDINYNNNGAGNNSNIALMGELQFSSVLDNGNSNYQQAFGRIISSVGVNTQSAQIKRDAAESLLFQANERKQSTSGVNLDEEAANLIKFQQAYEASAQVISVARTLFQTVLDSVR